MRLVYMHSTNLHPQVRHPVHDRIMLQTFSIGDKAVELGGLT